MAVVVVDEAVDDGDVEDDEVGFVTDGAAAVLLCFADVVSPVFFCDCGGSPMSPTATSLSRLPCVCCDTAVVCVPDEVD